MTLRASKPAFNVREKLTELGRRFGLKGSELAAAETVQEARDLVSAGRKNLMINGSMQVAQRGTTSTVSNYGTVDRIRTSYTGGTITQTQENLTSSDTPFNSGFKKFFRLTNTAVITNTSTNHRRFLLRLEDQDLATSGWDYTNSNSNITLSMWVRSSVSQTFHWFLQTINGTGQRYTWDVTLSANTWTKISKTFPGNSNITFNNDNSLGVIFDCGMFYGTDFTDSGVVNDQWATFASGTRTQDFDDSWGTTVNATFDVTGVQLEVGKNATEFEHRSYGEELALCQRYYQTVGSTWYATRSATGTVYSNAGLDGSNIALPVAMRAAPTTRQYGTSNGYVSAFGFNTSYTNTADYNLYIGRTFSNGNVLAYLGYSQANNGNVNLPTSIAFLYTENSVEFDSEL